MHELDLRVTMLLQGESTDVQIGYHEAFRAAVSSGRVATYDAIPYRSVTGETDWPALWSRVRAHLLNSGGNVLFLQFFQETDIPDPRPFLRDIRSLPTRPLIIASCGDGYGPLLRPLPKSLRQAASITDLVLSSSLGRLKSTLLDAGARRVALMPLAACDVRFEAEPPGEDDRRYDVIFIGSRVGRNPFGQHYWTARKRHEYAIQLQRRYGARFAIYGHGWQGFPSWQGVLSYEEQIEACRDASVVFGGYPGSRQPFYASDRPFIQALSGTPVVDFAVDGVEALLEDRRDWLLFRSLPEATGLIDSLLNGRMSGRDIGRSGRQAVVERHLTTHRVDLILSMMEELLEARHNHREAHCPPLTYLVPSLASTYSEKLHAGW
jgi:hypothetical protein